jgi:uncharacterized protein YjbI with pentapeptide repeats
MKIEIKSISGKVLFEYDCEDNTIRKTLEQAIKNSADLRFADLRSTDLSSADLSSADLRFANLSSADLSSADLSSADLRFADLRSADLRYAKLSFANLSSADLSSAKLRSANLSYAKLDKRYIQVTRIGSAKRITTYCFDDDIIWCGCFTGGLEQFEAQVNETHKGNEQYLKEYLGFINYIKSLK